MSEPIVSDKKFCERLRRQADDGHHWDRAPAMLRESAERIERLTREQKALVSSLSDLNICCEAHMADVERLTRERDEALALLLPIQSANQRLTRERDELERWRQAYWDSEKRRLEACNRWYDAEKARIFPSQSIRSDAPSKTAPGCEWCAMGNEAKMGIHRVDRGLQYMVCEASPSDRPDDPPTAASSPGAPPAAALGCTRP